MDIKILIAKNYIHTNHVDKAIQLLESIEKEIKETDPHTLILGVCSVLPTLLKRTGFIASSKLKLLWNTIITKKISFCILQS